MIKNHNKAFGIALKKLREDKHCSQETLAFDADLTRAYISLLERGMRSPTLDTQVALCAPLGISLTKMSALVEQELALLIASEQQDGGSYE